MWFGWYLEGKREGEVGLNGESVVWREREGG